MPKKYTFVELLKKYTLIDEDFIDTFFKKFKIGHELEFHILDKDVAKYLNITLDNLRKRLKNHYSKNKIYYAKVDYIIVKTGNKSSVDYMLNYQCLERLSMTGDSDKSETVRSYFIKLREFLYENQKLINQAMDKYEDLKQYVEFDTIYFFAVDDRKDIFKIGRTNNIINILRSYNVGRIKEVDLKYLALVKNPFIIEKCMKNNMKQNQVINGREIYKIDEKKLKKIIDDCYCKYVSSKQNEQLYNEIADLLGLYNYVKDKVNIKPYIVIGQNIGDEI
jgi:phage anti-repressor protein